MLGILDRGLGRKFSVLIDMVGVHVTPSGADHDRQVADMHALLLDVPEVRVGRIRRYVVAVDSEI